MQHTDGIAGLRPATADHLDAIRSLLEDAGLPVEGAADQLENGFVVMQDEEGLAGVAGIEIHGDYALLRSVAVAPSRRGRGFGEALVQDRIGAASERGLRAVYLPTTTAADWFAARGFAVVDRDTVPDSIRASREFAETCPASATAMTMRLD
jgi:amino-acid N-acetyltransferase